MSGASDSITSANAGRLLGFVHWDELIASLATKV